MRSPSTMNISESCYLDIPSPTYNRYIFDFEKNFDYWGAFFWFEKNWTICIYFLGAYLTAIFAGQHYMKSRPPFQLRGALIAWNALLALFNIVSTIRILPEALYMWKEYGFYGSMCVPGPLEHKQAGGFWATAFTVFKLVELGDTAFIVLRKTPLSFLHWYHHVSVVVFTWGNSAYPSAIHQYFYLANILMHCLVYSYLALKALRVSIPRRVNIVITCMQLLEMLFGIYVTYCAYRAKAKNPGCCVFDQAITIAVSIYASYFVLFLNFFIKSYITNKGVLFDEKGSIKKLA